jgi:hypothetical protein
MIHQETSHYLCSNTKKVSPILPVYSGLIHETQISFVYQSRWLQSVIGTFAPEVIRRKLSEFIVDYG